MVGQGVCCSVCDSANKAALVCPSCINNTLLFERRKMLLELSDRRTALLHKLNIFITQRQANVDLEVRRQAAAAEAAHARERVLQAEQSVEEAKLAASRLRADNAARRSAHQRACSELAARRSEHLAHQPTLLRYQALTHSHVAAMLLSEQRSKLAVLLDTLPLRVTMIRSASNMMQQQQTGAQQQQQQAGAQQSQLHQAQGRGGLGGEAAAPAAAAGPGAVGGGVVGSGGSYGGGASPIQVTLCNLKLPDGASVSSLMVQQPEATSTALGYLLLLAELLSTYLGGPLLHEGSFQGSTSVVWQQHSFWNRRPSSSNARLPLFLEEGGGGGGPGLSNPFPGLAAKVRGPSGWGSSSSGRSGPGGASSIPPHLPQYQQQNPGSTTAGGGGAGGAAAAALSAISRAFTGGGPPAAGAGAAGGGGAAGCGGGGLSYTPAVDEALLRQRHADLRLAYEMLVRSLACFSRDKVLPLGLQLPAGWGPVGWLALLCAALRRDPATEAVLAAAQQALIAGQGSGSGDLRVGAAGPGGGGLGAGPRCGAAGSCGGALGGAGGAAGNGSGAHDNDDDEAAEVEEDGWDVVQKPFLPPPPSQPEEVEHWTRAMFTDAHAAYGTAGVGGGLGAGGLGAGVGGAAAAAAAAAGRRLGLGGLGSSLGNGLGALGGLGGQGGPPAMSLERVRSIFSK